MGPQENYEYKGRKYTQTDLAGIAGIGVATIRYRLKAGWSVEEAVETPIDGRKKHCCRLFNGRELGVAEVARMMGVSKDAIYQRIHRGKTLRQIVDEWE